MEVGVTKRTTIKDVADKAGVSIGTVHCALAGKPGVAPGTRERIERVAKECNYRPNSVAASLKRKTVRLAAVLPGPTAENRFYFSYVWDGLHDYLNSMRDYNIELLELPYYDAPAGQYQQLARLLEEDAVDAALTLGYMNRECRAALAKLKKKGIPVVLVGSDTAPAERLCCVQPDYDVVGRTVAELLAWQAPSGAMMICAGNVATPAHYEIVLGIEGFVRDAGDDRKLLKLHHGGGDEYSAAIVRCLEENPDIRCCCAVNAHGGYLMGEALLKTGRAGTMPAIGCDVFEENLKFLEEGVFTNLIHKNPYSQAYTAIKCLAEYLLNGAEPARETLFVGSEIVFRSGIPMFRSGQQTLHVVVG